VLLLVLLLEGAEKHGIPGVPLVVLDFILLREKVCRSIINRVDHSCQLFGVLASAGTLLIHLRLRWLPVVMMMSTSTATGAHHYQTIKVVILHRIAIEMIVSRVRPLRVWRYLRNALLLGHVMKGRVNVSLLQGHRNVQVRVIFEWMLGKLTQMIVIVHFYNLL
jgi:hypothetical protein